MGRSKDNHNWPRQCVAIEVVTYCVWLAVAFSPLVRAQNDVEKSAWTGVYTKEQATSGKTLYGNACSSCHQETLGGDTMSPALAGDEFLSNWQNKNLRALYSRIISTMPASDPGSLTEKGVLDIVAYLLEANGFPAGSAPLETANELRTITMARPK